MRPWQIKVRTKQDNIQQSNHQVVKLYVYYVGWCWNCLSTKGLESPIHPVVYLWHKEPFSCTHFAFLSGGNMVLESIISRDIHCNLSLATMQWPFIAFSGFKLCHPLPELTWSPESWCKTPWHSHSWIFLASKLVSDWCCCQVLLSVWDRPAPIPLDPQYTCFRVMILRKQIPPSLF